MNRKSIHLLMLFLGITVKSLAQITVSGSVNASTSNEPLPGVNVTIKGTAKGTSTDAKGNYTISVPNKNAVLVFSFLGYVSQELNVGNKNQLNVSLNMICNCKEIRFNRCSWFRKRRSINEGSHCFNYSRLARANGWSTNNKNGWAAWRRNSCKD